MKITGEVHLDIFRNGLFEKRIVEKNLVVLSGRELLTKLLSADIAGVGISHVSFGINPTIPESSNTVITGGVSKPVIAITYPDRFSVKFDWELDSASCNGMSIVEFGLLASDGTLFARKTSEVIEKDNTINLNGSWIIKFDA